MPLLKRNPPPEPEDLIEHNGFWRPRPTPGTSHDGKRQQRSLIASATNISNGTTVNTAEALRLSKFRQAWQEDAWAYRDSIGELRFATTFLGNAARKVKLYPAAYVSDELDPLPLSEVSDCPQEVIDAANDAMERLAVNPLAMSGILRDLAENTEVTGEAWLIGWPPNEAPTQDNDEELWEIRSTTEIWANNEGVLNLREPGSSGSGVPIPDNVFKSRLWYPHPRRKALADSPFASILDLCEELLILSRDVRATGRSRLANSGLLLIPDGLTVVRAAVADDAQDQENDPFMQELVASAMTAIQDEGSASAIVPIIIRGPQEVLAAVRQVSIVKPESENAVKRIELIERMATAIDLPAEVLTGKADLNHWTAWAIDDDTFTDHIEPLIMIMDDMLVKGYMKVVLKASLGPQFADWINRVVIWHDATRLVRHPDRSNDAVQAYDRYALSDAALRDTMGFSDSDAPDNTELLTRVMMKQSRLDPTIAAQIIKRMDASIDISGVQTKGGQGQPPAQGGPSAGVPASQAPAEGAPQNANPQPPVESGENPYGSSSNPVEPSNIAATTNGHHPKALTAAAPAHVRQGSSKLQRIDADLANKLSVAANAAMSRALEKAGARIRTQVGKTAAGRAWCASHSNLELPFLISHSMIAAAGLDEHLLLQNSWSQLQTEYQSYVEDASSDTLNSMAKMLKVDPDALSNQLDALEENGKAAWSWLESRLGQIARGFLSDSASLAGEQEEITTTSLVPWDVIKQAIARIGGQPDDRSAGVTIGADPTTPGAEPLTGIGNGPVVTSTLVGNGLEVGSYTWVHGTTPTPFPPHESLDGVEFGSWTDDILANDGDFPGRNYFMPGDHDGCTCDFQVNWAGGEEPTAEDQEAPEAVAASVQFYEGQARQEHGRFGEGKLNPDQPKGPTDGMDRKTACQYGWDNAGMAKGTAGKLYDAGKLDDAIATAQSQTTPEETSHAQDVADQKYSEYQATISPEDREAAEARHAASSRAGGDDRPGYPTRVRMAQKLTAEFGDGHTCPCIYCGRTLEPGTISLDRLVPGSEGGKYIMPNLAPTCYECNQRRGDDDYTETMADAKDWLQSTGLAAAAGMMLEPVLPLGSWVTAKCIGYSDDPTQADPDSPADIPLEEVSGKLDGYSVDFLDYYKHIVAGYDVDPETVQSTPESETEDEGTPTLTAAGYHAVE